MRQSLGVRFGQGVRLFGVFFKSLDCEGSAQKLFRLSIPVNNTAIKQNSGTQLFIS